MAEIVRDSIGEGIIIAQQLPPSFAHELIKEVNIAFINAFNIVPRYYSRNNHANIGGRDYVCSFLLLKHQPLCINGFIA